MIPDNPHPDGVEIAPGLSVPRHALAFTFARSSGPGGQNVNKLNTKAQLSVALADLAGLLHAEALDRLRALAGSKLTADDRLVIESDEHRSQSRNRDACIEKLRALINTARVRPKRRRKTRPSRGAKERRIQDKKERGEIKSRRNQRFD